MDLIKDFGKLKAAARSSSLPQLVQKNLVAYVPSEEEWQYLLEKLYVPWIIYDSRAVWNARIAKFCRENGAGTPSGAAGAAAAGSAPLPFED